MDTSEGASAAGHAAERCAHLRAFARYYFAETARIAVRLMGGVFAEGAAAPDVRAAFVAGLRWVP